MIFDIEYKKRIPLFRKKPQVEVSIIFREVSEIDTAIGILSDLRTKLADETVVGEGLPRILDLTILNK